MGAEDLRAEVEKEYNVDKRGIIRSPGKFEAEPWWAVVLWNNIMEGFGGDTVYDGDLAIDVFELADADRKDYELEESDYAILVWESDQGFVNTKVLTQNGYDKFMREIEEQEEEEYDDEEAEEDEDEEST